MWDYVFFTIYLKTKDHTELNGAETFVVEKILCEDNSWIPDGVALAIPRVDANAEREERTAAWFKAVLDKASGTQDVLVSEIAKINSTFEKNMTMMKRQIQMLKGELKTFKEEIKEKDEEKGNSKSLLSINLPMVAKK